MEGSSFKFHVDYTVGDKVEGDTSKALLGDNTNELVRTFPDKDTAFDFFKRYKNERLPNFLNVTWLNVRKSNFEVLMEGGGFEVFDPNEKMGFSIWEVSSDQRSIIAMGYPFTKLLKGIKTGLGGFFRKNKYHGNLLKGILISKNLDVKLFNVADQTLSIKDGIEQDLEDLITLVESIITNNQHPTLLEPEWISPLLKDFNNLFKNMNLHSTIGVDKYIFRAYFLFNNPIFADKNDRMVLTQKLIHLRSMQKFKKKLDKSLSLKTSPADMGDWWLRLPKGCYLSKILYYEMDKFLIPKNRNPVKPIMGFCRDCFKHKDVRSTLKGQVEEFSIETSFLEFFPDFLPKVYYEFVRLVAPTEFKGRKLYSSYMEYFKKAYPRIP